MASLEEQIRNLSQRINMGSKYGYEAGRLRKRMDTLLSERDRRQSSEWDMQQKLKQQQQVMQQMGMGGQQAQIGGLQPTQTPQPTETAGAMASVGQQISPDAQAAEEALFQLGKRRLDESWQQNVRQTMGGLLQRGVGVNPALSSIAGEAYGDDKSNYGRALADLTSRTAASRFGVQGQQISNIAAQQGIGLAERQTSLQEQQQRWNQYYQMMGLA